MRAGRERRDSALRRGRPRGGRAARGGRRPRCVQLERAPQAPIPLMRPLPVGSDSTRPDPNQLACYPLVPWSNRIGHGRFSSKAARSRCAELPAESRTRSTATAGSAPGACWTAAPTRSSLGSTARLARSSIAGMLDYELRDDALIVELSVDNRGEARMPFGLGLHPWFDRTPGVRLRARRKACGWPGTGCAAGRSRRRSAPTGVRAARPLPHRLVDNCFTGWSGAAEILGDDVGIRLEIAHPASALIRSTCTRRSESNGSASSRSPIRRTRSICLHRSRARDSGPGSPGESPVDRGVVRGRA